MSEEDLEHERSEAGRLDPPGARLAAARKERGLELAAAAETIGVPRGVLSALEEDAWDRLDAPVYVRGYLRKYARLLGLDQEEVLAAYEASAAPHDPAIHAHATEGLGTRREVRWLFPVGGLIIVVVLILAGLWGWHRLRNRPAPVQAPAAAASAMMAHGAATDTSPESAAARTRSEATAATSSGMPSGTGETPSAGGGIHLQLQVLRPSWIEVYGPDNDRLYYNLAAAGTELHFDKAKGPVNVFLGNVSGVKVKVNGVDFRIPDADISGNTARFELHLKQSPPPPGTAP